MTRQRTKLRNEFNNIMAACIKSYKVQLFKINQPGELLGKLSSKIAGSLMKVAVPLAEVY